MPQKVLESLPKMLQDISFKTQNQFQPINLREKVLSDMKLTTLLMFITLTLLIKQSIRSQTKIEILMWNIAKVIPPQLYPPGNLLITMVIKLQKENKRMWPHI